MTVWTLALAAALSTQTFDHHYATYAAVLDAHVRASGVDYAALKADRSRLDQAIAELNAPAANTEASWTRDERLAFWINAYNMLTLRAVVDHYPIRAGWFTRAPRNSIRQIDGVWSRLKWQVAGQAVTLDDIEHRIVRPLFREARIHFALNCASTSCPSLAQAPYVAARLDTQLDDSARRYFASVEGVRLANNTFSVSSLFKWYGEDFVAQYAVDIPGTRPATERAVLGVLSRFAPPPVAERARRGDGKIRFLDYNWSLNDITGSTPRTPD